MVTKDTRKASSYSRREMIDEMSTNLEKDALDRRVGRGALNDSRALIGRLRRAVCESSTVEMSTGVASGATVKLSLNALEIIAIEVYSSSTRAHQGLLESVVDYTHSKYSDTIVSVKDQSGKLMKVTYKRSLI